MCCPNTVLRNEKVVLLKSWTKSATNSFQKWRVLLSYFSHKKILLQVQKGIIHTTGFEASPICQPIPKTEGRATEGEEPRMRTLVLTSSHSPELPPMQQAQPSKTIKHTDYNRESFVTFRSHLQTMKLAVQPQDLQVSSCLLRRCLNRVLVFVLAPVWAQLKYTWVQDFIPLVKKK